MNDPCWLSAAPNVGIAPWLGRTLLGTQDHSYSCLPGFMQPVTIPREMRRACATAWMVWTCLLLAFAINGARGQWHRLAGNLGPRMRYSHGAAVAGGLGGARRLLVTHGYNKQHGPEFLDDAWARTLPDGDWEAVDVGPERPAARLGHALGEKRRCRRVAPPRANCPALGANASRAATVRCAALATIVVQLPCLRPSCFCSAGTMEEAQALCSRTRLAATSTTRGCSV